MPGHRPAWALFDLNGTLLDPQGIAEPLGGTDRDRDLVAGALREALLLSMADTLSGGQYRPLPDYLRAALERALRAGGRDTVGLQAAMERAAAMEPSPGARAALDALRDAGIHAGVLTNSAARAAERALAACGLRDRLEAVIGGDAVRTFKPHPRVYGHAAAALGVPPGEICLISAHAWDVMGAMRAGMRGAWVARTERWRVPLGPEPDLCGDDLEDVARRLATLAPAPGPGAR